MRTTRTMVAAALLLLAAVCPLGQAFITEDDKEELLNAHNFYRSKVSPIATNMAKLVSPPIAAAISIATLHSLSIFSQEQLVPCKLFFTCLIYKLYAHCNNISATPDLHFAPIGRCGKMSSLYWHTFGRQAAK